VDDKPGLSVSWHLELGMPCTSTSRQVSALAIMKDWFFMKLDGILRMTGMVDDNPVCVFSSRYLPVRYIATC